MAHIVKTEPKVIDKLVSFDEDTDGSLIIKHEQYIPDDFISQLKRDKIDADHAPTGEMFKACSIPVVLVEQWKREGFDIMVEPIRDVIARLKKAQLDAFISSNKSF
jgi:hypothetical protein